MRDFTRLIMVFFLAGGLYATAVDARPVYEVRDLLQSAEALEGQTVRMQGFVTEVCTHKGCNVIVHDLRDGVRSAIKVEKGERMAPFGPEINGEEVEVTAAVRVLKIDADYLNKWEADVLSGRSALNADGSDHSHGDVDPEVEKARTLRQIALYRQRIEQGTRGYLLSVWLEADRVEVRKRR